MKSKKLISFLCAAAMTVSSFAGLAVTASAAETTLWSDSFNGYENVADHTTNATAVGKVLADGTHSSVTYDGIEGITLTTVGRGNGDDSSFFQITEGATGEALTTQISRFATVGRGASITFDETYAPAADKDLVLAFKTKTSNAGETSYDTAIQINGTGYLDLAAATDWTDVKVVITPSGATAYVGSADGVALADITNLASIKFDAYVNGVKGEEGNTAKAASNPIGYPTISLDDVVVYTTDAGNGAASTVPAAENKNQGEVTYEAQAPVPEAPGKVEKLTLGLAGSDDMSNVANDNKGRLIFLGTTAQEFTDLATVNLAFPSAGNDRSDTNWKVNVVNTDPTLGVTDQYIQATNATDSTANRGGRMYFKKNGEVYNIEEREAVVAQFATRLHANGAQPAEVIFSGDLVASDSKGNLASPLAMITTDAEAASAVYAVNNPLTKGGDKVLQVNDNEWVLVTITAYRSEGKTAGAKIAVTTYTDGVANDPVYIFGSADSYGAIQDNTKSGVNNMPYITFRSGNSDDYGVSGTKNDIDNIYLYASTVDPSATPAPTPTAKPTPVPKHDVTIDNDGQVVSVSTTESAAFDGVLIHAKYNGAALASVKSYPLTGISSAAAKTQTVTDTVNAGDKFMVWNSLNDQVPYGTAIAKGPAAATEAPATEAPATEAPATTAPTAAATATPTTAAATPTPTAATATATPEVPAGPTPTPNPSTVIAAAHTASSVWGSNNPAVTVDSALEHFNNDAEAAWTGLAFITFDLSDLKSLVETATLNYAVKGVDRNAYDFSVFYLTEDVDISTDLTHTAADRFTGKKTKIGTGNAPKSASASLTLDVADAVNARLSAGSKQITFAFTESAGSADLYGNGSTDATYKAPTLSYIASDAPIPTPAPTTAPTDTPEPTDAPSVPTGSASPAPAASASPEVPTGSASPAPAASSTPEVPTGSASPAPAASASPEVPTGSASPAPAASATPEVPAASATPAPATVSSASIAKRTGATYSIPASNFGNVTFDTLNAETNTYAATGVLKKVTGVTDMGEDYKDGYFLTYDITIPEVDDYTKVVVSAVSDQTTSTPIPAVTKSTTFNASNLTEDFITYIDPTAKKITVTVDLDGEGTKYNPVNYIIDLTGVTLQKDSSATIAKRTGATYGIPASNFGNVTFGPLNAETNTYAATGKLYKNVNVTDMGEDYKDGYFLTYDVTIPEVDDYTKVVVSAVSDQTTRTPIPAVTKSTTFNASNLTEDFITYIDTTETTGATKVTVTVDLDGDGNAYAPVEYVIDLAGVTCEETLLPMTAATVIDFDDYTETATFAETSYIKDMHLMLIPKSDKAITISSSGKVTINGHEHTGRLQLGGTGSATELAFKLLPGVAGTLEIDFVHSNGTPSDSRYLVFKQGDDTEEVEVNASQTSNYLYRNVRANEEVTIYSKKSGLNFYEIRFVPNESVYSVTTTNPNNGAETPADTATIAVTSGMNTDKKVAKAGDKVTFTVTPATGYAISGLPSVKQGATDVAVTAEAADNTYSFTMPEGAVAITATMLETSDGDPATIAIVADKSTVAQGGTVNFTKTVTDANSKATTKNGVTWGVYTDAEASTAADAAVATITDGVLTVKANADVDKLYVQAVSSETGFESLKSNIVTVNIEEAVASDATVLSFTKGGTGIQGVEVTATPDAYTVAAAGVPAALTLTGTTDANGQVSLKLNPNRAYKITAEYNGVKIVDAQTLTAGDTAETYPIAAATTGALASDENVPAAVKAAIPGETVTVTAEEGKKFASATIKDTAETPADVATTPASVAGAESFTFKMPAGGLGTYEVTYQQASSATITIDENNTPEGDPWTVAASALGDYTITAQKAIVGTANYTDYSSAFGKDKDDNDISKGYYVPFKLTVPAANAAKAKFTYYSNVTTEANAYTAGFDTSTNSQTVVMYLYSGATKTTSYTFVVDLDGDEGAYTPTTYTYTIEQTETEAEKDSKLYTAPQKFNVTFDANGGEFPAETTGTTAKVSAGGTASAPSANPTKANAAFAGWALSTAPTEVVELASTAINADTTFVAVWTDLYTITLPAAPITGGSVAVTTPATVPEAGLAAGTDVVITATPTEGYHVKTLTVKNGEDTVVDTDSDNTTYTFTMPAGDVTIAAEFAENPTVLTSSGDTEITRWTGEENTASTNHGAGETMRVNKALSSYNWKSFGLVKFAKPANKTKVVTKATLRLYLTSNGAADANIDVYSTGESDWDESKVVYYSTDAAKDSIFEADTSGAALLGADSAIGALSATPVVSKTISANAPAQWVEFDVTSYVKDCGDDYSFALSTDSAKTPTFATKESTDKTLAPQLVIEYGDEDATTTPKAARQTINVTAPDAADGTLSVSKIRNVRANDEITITATPATGKKLVSVSVKKVSDDSVVTVTDNKFTMPAEAVTVSATFARADVTAVTIASESTSVQKGTSTATYTATVKAGTTTLTGADAAVTWGVKAAATDAPTSMTGITISNEGVLTVPNSEDAVGNIIVTASIKKDITNASTDAENIVDDEFAVTIVGEPVYGLTKATVTNGSIAFTVGEDTNATQVKQSQTLKIVPTPSTGYEVTSVAYKLTSDETDDNWVTVTKTGDDYTVAGTALSGNITVKATFTAIDYTISNSNAVADANSNSLTIKVGSADASTAASVTAHVNDTITIVPDLAQGYRLATLTYNDGTDHDILSAKSFKMPAGNVTVAATFETWDGIYTNMDFEAETIAESTGNSSADLATTGWLKRGGTGSTSTYTIRAASANTEFTNGSGNVFYASGQNANSYLTLSPISATSDEAIKISLDLYYKHSDGQGDLEFNFGDGTSTILRLAENRGGTTAISPLADGLTLTQSSSSGAIYYYDYADAVWKETGLTATAQIKLSGTINADGTASFTLNDKTISLTNVPTHTISRFDFKGVRVDGSHKGTMNFDIDNILITAPWYSAPVTP